MKPFRDQNLYEVLDVSPTVSRDALAKAYASAKRTFSGDSLGSYSLFDPHERAALLARLDEAWQTLSDPERRAIYDRDVLKLPDAASAQAADHPSKPPAFQYAELGLTEVTGAALRARREAVGMPLQDIALQTRISIAYLQFVEEDHVRGLPHDSYLRGYLTQYARAIGLDPRIVADGYLRHLHALRNTKK